MVGKHINMKSALTLVVGSRLGAGVPCRGASLSTGRTFRPTRYRHHHCPNPHPHPQYGVPNFSAPPSSSRCLRTQPAVRSPWKCLDRLCGTFLADLCFSAHQCRPSCGDLGWRRSAPCSGKVRNAKKHLWLPLANTPPCVNFQGMCVCAALITSEGPPKFWQNAFIRLWAKGEGEKVRGLGHVRLRCCLTIWVRRGKGAPRPPSGG